LKDVQVPGDTLERIDGALQARFFQKNPDGTPKERWDLETVNVGCPPAQFQRHLWLCGFSAPRIPSRWQYTRAGWPGALVTRVAERLADLLDAWESGVRWEENIVLGGKREIMTGKEGPEAVLALTRPKLRVTPDEVRAISAADWPKTEIEMMRWLWERVVMPVGLQSLPTEFVDAPMKPPMVPGGKLVRPSTEDTIMQHLSRNPSPGGYIIFSGAPYGMAQDEAFWALLGPHGHTVETVGHAAPVLPIENFMREVAGCVNRIRKARRV
jgi:hypothetical protein